MKNIHHILPCFILVVLFKTLRARSVNMEEKQNTTFVLIIFFAPSWNHNPQTLIT